ncbi:uncharacterized protein LOC134718408 [Mytilus trossulus]|uniref:uncharacterized protein LOC134718408 n=1 Tax=Mytilus trossulus TaxID=6551 RepID=UPI00300450C1
MGRKLKGGFKTRQQKERLKKVSAGLLERRNNVDLDPSVLQLHDHCYSSLDSVREQNVPSNVKSWNSGRRIVELGVLAEGLSGCKKCGLPLQLAYASDILIYGLSAIIKIPCNNIRCQHMFNVQTGKRHDKIWDANTKLATAMVHTGIGGRRVNSFLTALNIPPVSNTLLSARQKESGSAIETVAETTIAECLSQEIDITKQKFDSNELTEC